MIDGLETLVPPVKLGEMDALITVANCASMIGVIPSLLVARRIVSIPDWFLVTYSQICPSGA